MYVQYPVQYNKRLGSSMEVGVGSPSSLPWFHALRGAVDVSLGRGGRACCTVYTTNTWETPGPSAELDGVGGVGWGHGARREQAVPQPSSEL